MANPTTNYGWVLPTPTDLVTDLPADFDVALQGVDTTTKALNPSTTLGDIQYRSATANTNTRLGIGSSGQVLAVSGGVPAWTTVSSGGMTLLSTTTLSGTSTTVSSISGAYNDLYVVISGVNQTVTTYNLQIRPNASTNIVDMSGTFRSSSTGTTGFNNSAIDHADGIIENNTTNAFQLEIYNYASATANKTFRYTGVFRTTSATPNYTVNYGGGIRTTSAITSLVFTTSQGSNSFTAGTVLIYGVK